MIFLLVSGYKVFIFILPIKILYFADRNHTAGQSIIHSLKNFSA